MIAFQSPDTGPAYEAFLAAKAVTPARVGFEIDPAEVNPILKPHAAVMVRWMVGGGRRACFAAFGLNKTVVQLEAVRITRHRAGGRGLIVLPLGVRQEFIRDAQLLATGDHPAITDEQRAGLAAWIAEDPARVITPKFIRRIEEAEDPEGLYLTNYETVRDGKLDPSHFTVVSLDEASCLRGFGGTKTFREFMRLFGADGAPGGVPYRFLATATPAPNEYIELLAYAAFLDVMDVGQAKTRFFRRNSEHADALTLHPHKEREFWLWVASWGLFVQRPSDLGFSDEGYDLPALKVIYHEVPVDHLADPVADKSGRVALFKEAARGVVEAAREKRDTLDARVAKMGEVLAAAPEDHFILWHDLEAERAAIEAALPRTTFHEWQEFRDGHPDALALYERHYSAYQYSDGRERKLLAGPGFKTVLMTPERDALFVWRKFLDDSGQTGVNGAVFRNEGRRLSSTLIEEAMAVAWQRWPGERLYTYVDATQIASTNPGYCFKVAGWRHVGRTKGGLDILAVEPDWVSVMDIACRTGLRSVYGAQDIGEREDTIIGFSDGDFQYLAAKPVIAGSGCNFQRHCHKAVFLGIGFKFNDFIQAIHRIQRFLQPHAVEVHVIYAESERAVLRKLQEKWRRHDEMVTQMSEIIREFGLSDAAFAGALTRALFDPTERIEVTGERFRLVHNDCVQELRGWDDDSVDLIVTSIPFATQYEYTPSFNDFGHTDDNGHFWRQMGFLIPELFRVLKPGRVAAIHIKDRIIPGGMTGLGFQTVYPFGDDCRMAFRDAGFAYLGQTTNVTDVVRENNQTYRLGWTEQCKDGTRMGVGLPEYVLRFRKPPTDASNGYADNPVVKAKREHGRDGWNGEGYSRARWQVDAHGFHRSSGDRLLTAEELVGLPADVIYRLFRKHGVEAVYDYEHHVRIGETLEAHGQLPPTFMLLAPESWHPDVWTDVAQMLSLNSRQAAKGALKHGRRGAGIELNPGYFLDGCAYVEAMAREKAMPGLFDALEIIDAQEAA